MKQGDLFSKPPTRPENRDVTAICEGCAMSLASVEAFADLWLLDGYQRRELMLVAIEVIKPFNVYVDESIQYEKPDNRGRMLYAVTAYTATFDKWIALEAEWQRHLDLFGSPPFHFTDFMSRGGDFANLEWSNSQRNDFIELLCVTAASHTIAGFGCGIYQDDYEKALPEDLREAWKDPYYFCIYGMLSLIEGAGRRNIGVSLPRPLYFLFEEKQAFSGAALRLFTEFKEVLEKTNSPNADLFGYASFGPKKSFKPLQAADLLVSVVNRRFKEMVFKLPSKMAKPLDRLNRKRNVFVAFPNKQLLAQYVEFLREDKGLLTSQDRKRKAGT